MEFQIGMLSISIDSLGAYPLSNFGEDPLCPLSPFHCWRKAGKYVQVCFPTEPSAPGEVPLNRDAASGSCLVPYGLNLAFHSITLLRQSFLFIYSGTDFL